jgi:hypothetical protein
MKVHLNRTMTIAQALVSLSLSETSSLTKVALDEPFDPLPPQILSGNFWLLAAGPKSLHASRAWFQPNGAEAPTVAPLRRWIAAILGPSARSDHKSFRRPNRTHPISHYLLLPAYDWGISDWHLNAVKPFVKKYRPTLGFSLAEAILAGRVTVVGNPEDFPDEALDELRVAGCLVERISGDGMSIATQLADK